MENSILLNFKLCTVLRYDLYLRKVLDCILVKTIPFLRNSKKTIKKFVKPVGSWDANSQRRVTDTHYARAYVHKIAKGYGKGIRA